MQPLIPLPCNKAMVLRAGLVFLGLAGLAACAPGSSGARAQDLGALLTAPAPAPVAGPTLAVPKLPRQAQRRFTAENPARIMVIGDSLSQGFADGLQQRARERGIPAVVLNRGRVSTGLARSDFHDWPADFANLAATERPDIVVAHFGANDMQGVVRDENRALYGTEGWPTAYRTEARRILTVAAQEKIVLVWLGPAPDGNRGLGRHMTVINPLFEAEAAASGAIYLPLGPVTAAADGSFAKAVAIDGRDVTIRTGDGSHFNMTGYRLVGDHILDNLQRRFPDLRPGGDQLAVLQ